MLKPHRIRQLSPIEQLTTIKTPIMLIESGGEREEGRSGAKPFFNGLCAVGVEAKLIYYPKAYHNGGWNDEYKRDYMKRLVAWFDYCIKGKPLPVWFTK